TVSIADKALIPAMSCARSASESGFFSQKNTLWISGGKWSLSLSAEFLTSVFSAARAGIAAIDPSAALAVKNCLRVGVFIIPILLVIKSYPKARYHMENHPIIPYALNNSSLHFLSRIKIKD